jgi:hypothetical protein
MMMFSSVSQVPTHPTSPGCCSSSNQANMRRTPRSSLGSILPAGSIATQQ